MRGPQWMIFSSDSTYAFNLPPARARARGSASFVRMVLGDTVMEGSEPYLMLGQEVSFALLLCKGSSNSAARNRISELEFDSFGLGEMHQLLMKHSMHI